jgi:hypothetical protein
MRLRTIIDKYPLLIHKPATLEPDCSVLGNLPAQNSFTNKFDSQYFFYNAKKSLLKSGCPGSIV